MLLSMGLPAHDFNVLLLFVKFCHYEKICAAFDNRAGNSSKDSPERNQSHIRKDFH